MFKANAMTLRPNGNTDDRSAWTLRRSAIAKARSANEEKRRTPVGKLSIAVDDV
jgi:hypothetical protein